MRLATAILTATLLVHAQPASPKFDVASIRVHSSAQEGGTSVFEGASYRGRNVTLRRLIGLAYLPIQEFTGGPAWIDSEHYDILAKAEDDPNRQQLHLMLQALLADRFKLVIHKATKDAPAYALKLRDSSGKFGPGLKPADPACAATSELRPKGCGGFRSDSGVLIGRNVTLKSLAAELELGRPFVDATGLNGFFSVELHWTPDEFGTNALTAIREQLGLNVGSTKVPTEYIVIDGASRPTEN